MRKTIYYSVLFCFIIVFISGCAAQNRNIWPNQPGYYQIFYKFERISSAEEAAANIRNLQNDISIDNMTPISIEIDKYSVRAKLKWTEKERVETRSDSYGPWDLFGPSRVIVGETILSHNKEKTAIIPLNNIKSITLWSTGHVTFYMNTGSAVVVRANSTITAKTFADSVYTLAKLIGTKLKPRLGLSFQELSLEQKVELKVNYGLLVTQVERGGPADIAGMEFRDIILEVNGKSINKADEWPYLTGETPVEIIVMKTPGDKTGNINPYKKGIKMTPVSP